MFKANQRNRSGAEGEELVEEYVESGETQREFCEERGLCVGTLQYWLRKVGGRIELEETDISEERSVAPFVEVKVTATGCPTKGEDAPAYEVVVGNGRRLRIRGGFDVQEVATLLAILEE